MILIKTYEIKTSPIAKSRLLREKSYCRRKSVGNLKPVIGQNVSNWMCKASDIVVIDARNVNTSSPEFIDEGSVVVGSHTGPASALHLNVKNGY